VHKNAAAPMIAMLGRPELDTEVSNTGMETVESDDCKGMSRKDRDANGVLTTTQEEARFSYKDRWKFIDPFTQSINQWIMSGEPVVSKDQRAGRIKQSNIEVQIYTITSGKDYGQIGNLRDGAV